MIRHMRNALLLVLLLSLVSPCGSASARYLLSDDEWDVHIAPTAAAAADIPAPAWTTAAASAAPAPVAESLVYVVSSGDTLSKIAAGFGTTVATLQAYNELANPNFIQIGQKLKIPEVPVPLLEGKEPVIERVLSTTLTAYTAGVESTGKTPSHPEYGITFSGVRAEEGRTVAVDPKVIPLGSTVYIEGVGIRKAEDTGSAIKGSKIDVFMNDVSEARTFGVKRNVKVFVLSSA
ncbi:3D domain-containing protein [Paenibacillus sp. YN15]|uniref:3D domain-containing protein n=1 Tax=Paenibacillus sp. YN15 TaxID=1742774 RepID=UPI00215C1166|nr:3D domain-containing protein [Paenibacillus sp. YN15]